jgi:hypothetical protein
MRKLRNVLAISLLFLVIFSLSISAQNKLRMEVRPSASMSLYSSKTLDTYPSRTTEYTPILTGSYTINYLKALKNQDYLKFGVGLFSTGHEVSYSEDPPVNFQGRTDILKVHYVQVPICYLLNLGKFELGLGVSGNVLLDEKRIPGEGDKGKYLNDIPFDKFAFGSGAELNYTFKVSHQLGMVVGLQAHYLLTENQLNCGVNIGFEYKVKGE